MAQDSGVVVVTGAGSGLGRAMTIEFCRRGYRTVAVGRQDGPLAETARLAGERCQVQVLDVAQAEAVVQAFADIECRHGPVAVLVNNAAVYPRKDFLTSTPDHFMQAVDINLGGVVHCSHAALMSMVKRGSGRILNVATFADLNPLPASSAYSVSKGAARIFTRALIADVSDRFPGIVIGDWMPGMLDTGMGIPDGLAPETAARWGVSLALDCDPGLNGTTFEMDREILPPRSLKRKLKDLLLLRRPRPRRLSTDG